MIKRLFGRPRKVELEIQPHVGILPVRLGATSDEVRTVMKDLGRDLSSSRDDAALLRKLGVDPPEGVSRTDYYIENALQVEITDDDRVSFIGIAPHADIRATFNGRDVFDLPAEALFEDLKDQFDAADIVFDEASVLFPDQILTLWEADPQYDVKGERFPVWGQIGVGTPEHLKAVDGNRSRRRQS